MGCLDFIKDRTEGGICLQEKVAANLALCLSGILLCLLGLGILYRLPCRDELRVLLDAFPCGLELFALRLGQTGKVLAMTVVTTTLAASGCAFRRGGSSVCFRLSLQDDGRANQDQGEEGCKIPGVWCCFHHPWKHPPFGKVAGKFKKTPVAVIGRSELLRRGQQTGHTLQKTAGGTAVEHAVIKAQRELSLGDGNEDLLVRIPRGGNPAGTHP